MGNYPKKPSVWISTSRFSRNEQIGMPAGCWVLRTPSRSHGFVSFAFCCKFHLQIDNREKSSTATAKYLRDTRRADKATGMALIDPKRNANVGTRGRNLHRSARQENPLVN
jgi:hypothetical protein